MLTVGEVARRSGIAVSALHFYERQGLIESERANSNHRRYRRDVLRRVAVIKAAQRVGISIKRIQQEFALLPHSRTPTPADWQALSWRWREELDRRVDELTKLRDNLTNCIGCGCLSMALCPLFNPDDVLGQNGPGPHLLNQNKTTDDTT